jgi:hypothetical protein
MNNASLTPGSVAADARPRGRIAFGLTARALLLLLSGVLFLVPAFFIHSFVWGMLAWDLFVAVFTAA